ncbi:hypothetical protein HK102_008370, partial [Quaeritorhiza haematococci]
MAADDSLQKIQLMMQQLASQWAMMRQELAADDLGAPAASNSTNPAFAAAAQPPAPAPSAPQQQYHAQTHTSPTPSQPPAAAATFMGVAHLANPQPTYNTPPTHVDPTTAAPTTLYNAQPPYGTQVVAAASPAVPAATFAPHLHGQGGAG